jgi:hypothetical protein
MACPERDDWDRPFCLHKNIKLGLRVRLGSMSQGVLNSMNFETFSLDARLNAGIKEVGFVTPTPIQQQAIPHSKRP